MWSSPSESRWEPCGPQTLLCPPEGHGCGAHQCSLHATSRCQAAGGLPSHPVTHSVQLFVLTLPYRARSCVFIEEAQ